MQRSKQRKQRKGNDEQMTGTPEMSLRSFLPVMWPTTLPVKLVYSDYRTLTCSGSLVQYVYRLNSLFDPDESGIGGQPDGFDQLKTLYGRYRVMAVDVEVQAIGQSVNGLIAMAPSDTNNPGLSPEELGGLRYAATGSFSGQQRATLKKRYHIGKLLGYSDASMLASSNVEAAITANPTFQQYLIIGVEGGSSATQVQNVWVRLTYYARMEVPIAVLDTAARHRARFVGLLAPTAVGAVDHPLIDTQARVTPSQPKSETSGASTTTAAPVDSRPDTGVGPVVRQAATVASSSLVDAAARLESASTQLAAIAAGVRVSMGPEHRTGV